MGNNQVKTSSGHGAQIQGGTARNVTNQNQYGFHGCLRASTSAQAGSLSSGENGWKKDLKDNKEIMFWKAKAKHKVEHRGCERKRILFHSLKQTSLPIGGCDGGGVSGSRAAIKASIIKGDADEHHLS